MSKSSINVLQADLGLSNTDMTTLFGVCSSTWYRWISKGEKRMDPLPAKLLTYMKSKRDQMTPMQRLAWGRELQQAIAIGGTLRGLGEVLKDLKIKP